MSTKASLEALAGLATELGHTLPLKLDQPGYGVSRMSASLHLLYHQVRVKIQSQNFINLILVYRVGDPPFDVLRPEDEV